MEDSIVSFVWPFRVADVVVADVVVAEVDVADAATDAVPDAATDAVADAATGAVADAATNAVADVADAVDKDLWLPISHNFVLALKGRDNSRQEFSKKFLKSATWEKIVVSP